MRFTYTLIDKHRGVCHIGHQTVMIERWNEATKEFDVIAEPVRILPLGFGEEYCRYCRTDTYRVTKRDGLLGTEFYSHEFVIRSLGYGRQGWVRESEVFEGHRLCVYQDPKYHEWRARKEANKLKMVRDNLETAYRCYCLRMEKRGKPKMSMEDFEFTKKQEKAKKISPQAIRPPVIA